MLLPVELGYLLDPTGPRAPYPDRPVTVPAVASWLKAHATKLTPWLRDLTQSDSNAGLARQALDLIDDGLGN